MDQKKSTRLRRAVNDLAAARRLADQARRTLADATDPGDEDLLVSSSWWWAAALLRARRKRLLSIPGVVGCGLGTRKRNGYDTGEPCITVFVRNKWSKVKRKRTGPKIPRYVSSGKRRLDVDVVEAGKLERQGVAVGESIGRPGVEGFGSIGAYVQDFVQHGDAALTAMHVSGLRDFPSGNTPAPSFRHPGTAAGRPFGVLRRGTVRGIDAAMIGLTDPGDVFPAIPYIGPVRGWRPTSYPGDLGAPVRLYGARSGYQSGTILNPSASYPQFGLDSAVVADIVTLFGDSGCCLVDGSGMVLGFLVGRVSSGASLFCSVSLVLYRLQCDILTLS